MAERLCRRRESPDNHMTCVCCSSVLCTVHLNRLINLCFQMPQQSLSFRVQIVPNEPTKRVSSADCTQPAGCTAAGAWHKPPSTNPLPSAAWGQLRPPCRAPADEGRALQGQRASGLWSSEPEVPSQAISQPCSCCSAAQTEVTSEPLC